MKKLIDKLKIKFPIPVLMFFLLIFIIGMATYRDYGVSWDDPLSRSVGVLNKNYMLTEDKTLLVNSERHYGAAYELLLVFGERIFHLPEDHYLIYNFRHLINFLTYFCAVVGLYVLGLLIHKNWKLALCGAFFLVISPRIWGHGFFNTKDIPFLSVFIWNIILFITYLKTNHKRYLVLLAILSAFIVDIRITGILIPTAVIFSILFFNKNNHKWQQKLLAIVLYLVLTIILIIIMWPYLWSDPIGNFWQSWQRMSQFDWSHTVLFMGKNILAKDLPWYYLPFWIGISTPLSILSLALFGSVKTISDLFNKEKNYGGIILLGWIFIPLAIIIGLDSTVYDEWRHVFFVYPPICILASVGVGALVNIIKSHSTKIAKYTAYIFSSLVVLDFIAVMSFMIRNHPMQQLYFNYLVGSDYALIKKNYEFDYWGLGYKKALIQILKDDNRKIIRYKAANYPGEFAILTLPQTMRQRLEYVHDISEADYYLTNNRWDNQGENLDAKVTGILVENAIAIEIYKLR